jgi:hypothetical protein
MVRSRTGLGMIELDVADLPQVWAYVHYPARKGRNC